jgi:hypothetical protein
MTNIPDPLGADTDPDDIIRSDLDEHVEDSIKDPAYYTGNEPWQIRTGEADTLGIDIARYPRMIWAWSFFEAFTGTIHPNEINQQAEVFDRARILHKDILDQGATEAAFIAFAALYAGLTAHEAHVEYEKMNPDTAKKEG